MDELEQRKRKKEETRNTLAETPDIVKQKKKRWESRIGRRQSGDMIIIDGLTQLLGWSLTEEFPT